MKIKIYLPIIIVFGMTYTLLEEVIMADNLSQFKTLLLISFISFCLFYYCKWISARAANTEGLDNQAFSRALDNAIAVNNLKNNAYYAILFYFGVMNIINLNPGLLK